ncbi:MAG TPA: tetratricopeptide repeat protein [Clostridia bacterium]|nr:tetratricopeptide repeat protein [Clostridia bacterium]
MNKKVVTFERGAEFYFDLGYKYIQKGNMKTALRYIEKAVELKPKDSFIQFNYAGLLAELGDIDRSTEVLVNIVKNLDPDYLECYFGLGCNYLQMQKIKKSSEYFSLYLEKDPNGEFSEEAEELLEMLTMIKDANNNLDDEELEKIYKIEEEAIDHLEKREYEKATRKFETVVEMLPNAVPARNNLSLAYYYLGFLDKAIELAREVLVYEETNVHANCNLAIFYNKQGSTSWVEKQVRIISKIRTDNEDYLYKIGDTYGSLGRHTEALRNFKKLLAVDPENPMYVHLTAVAAYNSKKYKESIKLWERLSVLDNENMLSHYYIETAMKQLENEDENESICFPYVYQLPREEIKNRLDFIYKFIEMPTDECKAEFAKNKHVTDILYFGINFDKYFLRKLIFNKIKNDKLVETEAAIKRFMLRDDVENYMKMESVFLLNSIGAKEPYTVNFDGEIKNVTIDSLDFPESEWKKSWGEVEHKAISMMRGCYKRPYKKIVEDIWYEFIKSTFPAVPEIDDVNIWAAALEYTYCSLCNAEASERRLAEKYSIVSGSLLEKAELINNAIKSKFQYRKEKK